MPIYSRIPIASFRSFTSQTFEKYRRSLEKTFVMIDWMQMSIKNGKWEKESNISEFFWLLWAAEDLAAIVPLPEGKDFHYQ